MSSLPVLKPLGNDGGDLERCHARSKMERRICVSSKKRGRKECEGKMRWTNIDLDLFCNIELSGISDRHVPAGEEEQEDRRGRGS